MSIWDSILLIILAYFIYKGIRSGFVRLIGGFAGILVGAWAAGQFYDLVAQWLIEYFNMQLMTAIVVAFIIIYAVVNIIINVFVGIITKVFRYIPLATFTNRLIGGILGFLEGMLLLGLIIWVINLFPFQNQFASSLKDSRVAQYFEYSTKLVQPILPKGLTNIDLNVLNQLKDYGNAQGDYIRQNMPNIFHGLEKLKQDQINTMHEVDSAVKATTTP